MRVIKPTILESVFSVDRMAEFKGFVYDALKSLESSHSQRVKDKLIRWNNIYRGLPKSQTRSFPWENASNIVVQVVGQHTDTLTARILGSIYELEPLWPIKACGIYDIADKVEEKREALEQFLKLNALDSDELDFYRVEQLWFADAIKYGFKVIKAVHETRKEQLIYDDQNLTIPVYVGPKIENVNYEDFLCSSSYKTIEDCPIKAERLYFTRQDLEERRYSKKFKSSAVDKVLATSPDDNGATQSQKEISSMTGITTAGSTKAFDRWHVYECWLKYFMNGKTYSIVCYYHLASNTYLGGYFNYLPNNKEPYVSARLGYRTSDLYGQGFCELLEHIQEEATAIHNRRNDNATIANMRMFRISPKAYKLGQNIKLQPLSILRADKDEVEPLQLGEVYNSTFEEEQLLLTEAAARSGTSPAVAGSGSGAVNYKKGIYSSQGTQALMMDGNRRVNLDTMDMRYAHMKAGKLLLDLYSHFGVPESKLAVYGKQGTYISDALEQYKDGKLKVFVQAATASVNRELDRQNGIFLTQIFNKHFMSIGQLLQSVVAQQTPPQIKEYLVKVIAASDTLMVKVAKSFGLEDTNSFIPKPDYIEHIQEQQNLMLQQKKQQLAMQGENLDESNNAPASRTFAIPAVEFGEQSGVSDSSDVPGGSSADEYQGSVEQGTQ